MPTVGTRSDGPDTAGKWWMGLPYRIAGVFEGGGAKGVAYIGALKAVCDQGCWFSAVAGSSAGAITAALVAAGLTPDELQGQSLRALGMLRIGKMLTAAMRMRNYGGVYAKEDLLTWLDGLLAQQMQRLQPTTPAKQPVSFLELYGATNIELNIVAADLSMGRQVVFSHYTTPHCQVADAVVASSAIPFAFPSSALVIGGQNAPEGRVFHTLVDGGVWANFPLFVFKDGAYRQYSEAPALPKEHVVVGFLLQEQPLTRISLQAAKFDRNVALSDQPWERGGSVAKTTGSRSSTRLGRFMSAVLVIPSIIGRYCLSCDATQKYPLGPGRWPLPQSRILERLSATCDGFLNLVYYLVPAMAFLVIIAVGFAVAAGWVGYWGWDNRSGWEPYLAMLGLATIGLLAPPTMVVLGLLLTANLFLLRALRHLLFGLAKTYVAAPGAPEWVCLDKNVVALPVPEAVTMLSFDIGDEDRRHELNGVLESSYRHTTAQFGSEILPRLRALHS